MKFVQHLADDEVSQTPVIQFDFTDIFSLAGHPHIAAWAMQENFMEFDLDNLRLIAVFETEKEIYGMVVGYIFGDDRKKLDFPNWNDNLEIRNSIGEAFQIYRFYWLDGTTNTIAGRSEKDAFRRAGYGGGAAAAIDFISSNPDIEYVWDKPNRTWTRITPIIDTTPIEG